MELGYAVSAYSAHTTGRDVTGSTRSVDCGCQMRPDTPGAALSRLCVIHSCYRGDITLFFFFCATRFTVFRSKERIVTRAVVIRAMRSKVKTRLNRQFASLERFSTSKFWLITAFFYMYIYHVSKITFLFPYQFIFYSVGCGIADSSEIRSFICIVSIVVFMLPFFLIFFSVSFSILYNEDCYSLFPLVIKINFPRHLTKKFQIIFSFLKYIFLNVVIICCYILWYLNQKLSSFISYSVVYYCSFVISLRSFLWSWCYDFYYCWF